MIERAFYTDKDIAHLLNVSASWVRGQRFKRQHGLPHLLNLEPRLIGSCVRYVASEVHSFIEAIKQGR